MLLTLNPSDLVLCNEQRPSGEFFEFVNWTGACDMSRGTNIGQMKSGTGWPSGHALTLLIHGLWVRDWLCSTGEVLPTGLPRRSGQCPTAIDAASTGNFLSAMLRLVRARAPDGTGSQKENDRSLKPVLRLQVTDTHGGIRASSSSAICGHRAVRHLTMTSA